MCHRQCGTVTEKEQINLEGLSDGDQISSTSPTQKFEPHTAGVLAILPIPESLMTSANAMPQLRRHLLITGGYDDYVRVYDTGGGARAAALAELYIGHAVYRLKLLKGYDTQRKPGESRFRVLASCTLAGVRILEFTRNENGAWGIAVLASMTQHQSLCYASDVMPNPPIEVGMREGLQSSVVVVSTSMYDRLLCVWRFAELESMKEVDVISKPQPQENLILSELSASGPTL